MYKCHKEGFGYLDFINDGLEVIVIEHINYRGEETVNGIRYVFFKGLNKFWYISLKTLSFIKKENPDIVLVQGLIFPLQVIFLKIFLGGKSKLIAQHHGERPYKGIRKSFQSIADKFIDAYIFTSNGNAEAWIKNNLISNIQRCYEVLEASTFFTRKDKKQSISLTGIAGDFNILWVGRLEANKDPLTVLDGFERYVQTNPLAKLYIIYQKDALLDKVKAKIQRSNILAKSVHLKGKVNHDELPYWFSAADFYISGSHREGSGFALIESMACGCIPILTDIPSFRKITDNGRLCFLYEPGNSQSLYEALLQLGKVQKENFSIEIMDYFNNELSFKSIAEKLVRLFRKVRSE